MNQLSFTFMHIRQFYPRFRIYIYIYYCNKLKMLQKRDNNENSRKIQTFSIYSAQTFYIWSVPIDL